LNEKAFTGFVDYNKFENEKGFILKEIEIIPTSIGKFFPRFIRSKLSLFFNGLNSKIRCVYGVEK
jgi:hypothetical protein